MSKKAPRGQIIELGGEPRINFLPPEIQERKDARRRRRALFMLVVAVAVLCGISYFYANQYASDRQAALETEQALTLDLLAQQAAYSEARDLADRAAITGKAISHASRNEVRWRELINELEGALPASVTLEQWSAKGLSSMRNDERIESLFPVFQIAEVQLSVHAASLGALSTSLDSLSELRGVVHISIDSATRPDDGTGVNSVITVRFDSEVLEGRFADGWDPSMTPIPSGPPEPVAEPEVDPGSDEVASEAEESATLREGTP